MSTSIPEFWRFWKIKHPEFYDFESYMIYNPDPEKAAAQQQETLDALASAKGFIRKEIGRQIKLRHVPDLIFKIDKSLEYGRHIEEIISELDIKHDDEDEE